MLHELLHTVVELLTALSFPYFLIRRHAFFCDCSIFIRIVVSIMPAFLCDGIEAVIAGQSILHGEQAAAVPHHKRGNRLIIHMTDKFQQIHGAVEHSNSIFAVKVIPICKYGFTL